MTAGLKDDMLVFGQFFVHQRGQVVQAAQRRLGSEFTVAEEVLRFMLACQLDIFGLQMFLHGVQVDLTVRRQHTQVVLSVRPDNHRLGNLSRGNMLDRGQLPGGINRLVLGHPVLAVLFIEKL